MQDWKLKECKCKHVFACKRCQVTSSQNRIYEVYLILHRGNEHDVYGRVHEHIFVEPLKS